MPVVGFILGQDRPGHAQGTLAGGSRPAAGARAIPQGRDAATRVKPAPLPHRADVRPQAAGDVLSPLPLQRVQDRPSAIRFAAPRRPGKLP
jgi:hypothetical protein